MKVDESTGNVDEDTARVYGGLVVEHGQKGWRVVQYFVRDVSCWYSTRASFWSSLNDGNFSLLGAGSVSAGSSFRESSLAPTLRHQPIAALPLTLKIWWAGKLER